MSEEFLRQIQAILNYQFSSLELVEKAFTHSSAVDNRSECNERLEFLGDSVLGLIICEKLFQRYPDYPEGNLTKFKSMLVSRKTCETIVGRIGLDKFIRVGKGLAARNELPGSISAGLLEAVIAAVYIDGGLEVARRMVLGLFSDFIAQCDILKAHGNFKSMLQQHAQQKLDTVPVYELLDIKGPDHDKCFESKVVLADRGFPSAWGRNKKEAEQKAAYNALMELGLLKPTDRE